MESHLESATRVHLDLACVKLNNTEDELNKGKDILKKIVDKFDKTVALLSVKHTNVFLWRIDGCKEILKQAKDVGQESDPFYTKTETDGYGYKLKVKIYPGGCGDGENTHLSVFIIVMKGEYDAILPWPFKRKVKFILIDQQEDPDQRKNHTFELFEKNHSSFARPLKEENEGLGWSQFISHENLNSRRFIVDDTLFLQVEIIS